MDLELLELEQPVIELERCPGMLDIPLQQSGILTFMSLKKLMSVQAAIVRPTHPPPSSLHLPLVPQRESVSFQLLGVL